MQSLFRTLLLATTLLGADAINLLQPRDGTAPRVVQHDIQRRDIPDRLRQIRSDRNRMRKRDGDTLEINLQNEEALYLLEASLGTPPQPLALHLDTGSSDLWVNVASSDFCQEHSQACQAGGTYEANASSTYEYENSMFTITYVDGTGATGDYVEDTFEFGGVSLENQQFGVGYESSKSIGVLGIGYTTHEVSANYGETYPNVPQKLTDEGYIASNAYSLWLNDLNASTGNILFGGVDSAKYTGELQTLPVIQEQGGIYAELIIAMTAVGANGNVGSIAADLEYAALLDSGTSLMYLPNAITDAIFPALGAVWDEELGAASVDCSLAQSDETLDLTFSEPTIRIPMNELVLASGPNTCILGVAKAFSSIPVLGDTFLRSAYVVYNLEENEISLAQTKFQAEGEDIKEIGRSGDVPGAVAVQSAVTDVVLPSGAAAAATTLTEGSGAAPTAAMGRNVALLGAAAGMVAML